MTHALTCTRRPHIYAAFGSFKAVWRQQGPFAAGLLRNLGADSQAAAAELAGVAQQEEPDLAARLRRLLALLNCIAAIAQARSETQAACIAGVCPAPAVLGALPSVELILDWICSCCCMHPQVPAPAGK